MGTPPSRASQRLRTNLQALIAEFSLRAMDAPAVTGFLLCSASSSYQYIYLLFDHAVIEFDRAPQPGGCAWRKTYRLNRDPDRVQRFLAQLDDFKLPRGASAPARPESARPASARLATAGRPADSPAEQGGGAAAPWPPARRDPLVAALFGPRPAAPQRPG